MDSIGMKGGEIKAKPLGNPLIARRSSGVCPESAPKIAGRFFPPSGSSCSDILSDREEWPKPSPAGGGGGGKSGVTTQ